MRLGIYAFLFSFLGQINENRHRVVVILSFPNNYRVKSNPREL